MRLLDAEQRRPAPLAQSSLTLAAPAPSICTDLSVIQHLVEDAHLLTKPPQKNEKRAAKSTSRPADALLLTHASPGLVYVLVYDLILGRGFTPAGDTELAVAAAEPALRGALKRRLAAVRSRMNHTMLHLVDI